MVFKKLDFFSAFDTSRPHQIIDIQCDIAIMGGREVSRPYRLLKGKIHDQNPYLVEISLSQLFQFLHLSRDIDKS